MRLHVRQAHIYSLFSPSTTIRTLLISLNERMTDPATEFGSVGFSRLRRNATQLNSTELNINKLSPTIIAVKGVLLLLLHHTIIHQIK